MLRNFAFTAILGIAFFIVLKFVNASWVHPYIWYILAFFFGLSFLIYRLMEYGMKDNRKKFVSFYLSTVVGRLILSLIFIGIFLYHGLTDSLLFIINFFILYLCYTGFEIYTLYCNLRRD